MVAGGTSAQSEPNPLTGSHLYRSYCFVCHGADGKTAGPVAKKLHIEPADLSSNRYRNIDVSDLAEIIGGYRNGTKSNMPNWALVLSKADLLDIAAYVSKITSKDLKFRGDTRHGRVVFKRACESCHGIIGLGKGPLAHLFHIPMMDLTQSEYLKKTSDKELVKMIRDGKGEYMPSWEGTLSNDEIDDVASYVRMLAR
jgi:cbb3-type cytochrome c oxidase subunit III